MSDDIRHWPASARRAYVTGYLAGQLNGPSLRAVLSRLRALKAQRTVNRGESADGYYDALGFLHGHLDGRESP